MWSKMRLSLTESARIRPKPSNPDAFWTTHARSPSKTAKPRRILDHSRPPPPEVAVRPAEAWVPKAQRAGRAPRATTWKPPPGRASGSPRHTPASRTQTPPQCATPGKPNPPTPRAAPRKKPNGAGGWVPAPYTPASRRAPARDGGGEAVVPQAGLEPATGGFGVGAHALVLLAALLVVDVFAHLPALPGAPALPTGPARLALSRLPAMRTGFPASCSGGSVEHEHYSASCSGAARASRLGGAH